ncbi:hypothetical protein NQZ68_027162 [Dissostichus eleginoides]|nr:hypothetical protein NQZ68_027162 [Dissostichus eleginoides]
MMPPVILEIQSASHPSSMQSSLLQVALNERKLWGSKGPVMGVELRRPISMTGDTWLEPRCYLSPAARSHGAFATLSKTAEILSQHSEAISAFRQKV